MEKMTFEQGAKAALPMIYTLVTSLDKDGKPNALGVSWVTRTSIEPHLMLVSIDTRRYSHDGIALHGEFVVCYPSKEQAEGAWICGTSSGRDGDKIKKAGLTLTDSAAVKVPTIAESAVAFECKVIDQFTTGDHTVFVGEVVAVRGTPGKAGHLYYGGGTKLYAIGPAGELETART
ncbi:MAG: flavin reductase family protein [Planctomycetota bacterium]|jgi:flavin reductase (DIM6/NTAB) family NADH-FMN oxidoreductase RutF